MEGLTENRTADEQPRWLLRMEGGAGATNPTVSLLTGSTGTNLFALSSGGGSPGFDPFGHIHGRRFTATLPGIYEVGFKLFDTSTNGIGGRPIQSPSDVLLVYFQAGVNLQSIEPNEDHTHVRFAAPVGTNWQLQASGSPDPQANWSPIGNPVVGNDYFHEVEDDHPVEGNRQYRLPATA